MIDISCRQFAVSGVGLGCVHIVTFAIGLVGFGHSVDGLGWVRSGHRKWTHGQLWFKGNVRIPRMHPSSAVPPEAHPLCPFAVPPE